MVLSDRPAATRDGFADAGSEAEAPRAGGQAMSEASRRAARDGVGRGLRSLYADTVRDPIPEDLAEILGRFGGGGP
jgi:hypothetical protein